MSLRRMLKEEWRMHSRLYNGGSFALFPLAVMALSGGLGYAVAEFSTLDPRGFSNVLPVLGLFLGMGVGTVGFSSRDASRDVLGDFSFMVHTSRTLPVARWKLYADFILKDLVYYTAFFLLPVAIGSGLTLGFYASTPAMFSAFVLGLFGSLAITLSSISFPGVLAPSYSRIGEPVVQRSELDVERSAGGFFKLLFSFGLLAGFYWFLVLYFPLASIFLSNPMLSFSVMIGTMSLAVYNWLNRFDSPESYSHLPLSRGDLLEAKQKAFVRTSIPLIVLVAAAPYVAYSGQVLLALVTAASAATYSLGAASTVLGLDPNTRMYDGVQFSKLILLSSAVTIPLLVVSLAGVPWPVFLLMDGLAAVAGLALVYGSRKR